MLFSFCVVFVGRGWGLVFKYIILFVVKFVIRVRFWISLILAKVWSSVFLVLGDIFLFL